MTEEQKNNLSIEVSELAGRYNKLQRFMRTNVFVNLPRVDKDLLYEQSHAMLTYLQVLGKRCELHGVSFTIELQANG